MSGQLNDIGDLGVVKVSSQLEDFRVQPSCLFTHKLILTFVTEAVTTKELRDPHSNFCWLNKSERFVSSHLFSFLVCYLKRYFEFLFQRGCQFTFERAAVAALSPPMKGFSLINDSKADLHKQMYTLLCLR